MGGMEEKRSLKNHMFKEKKVFQHKKRTNLITEDERQLGQSWARTHAINQRR